jgi:drug/metabolite transporter (DMT)-like permease
MEMKTNQIIGVGMAIVGVLIICAPFFGFVDIGLFIALGAGLSLIGIGFFLLFKSSSDEKDELWSQKKTGK